VTAGWSTLASVPSGIKGKMVKDGGALVGRDIGGRAYVYALKGNNTCEFYRYDVAGDFWLTMDTMPAFGFTAQKKKVKRGGSLATCHA
jgi:hypothetical protein